MAKYYHCDYCGHKAQDARTLLSASYPRHPDGSNKGKHKLYEGSDNPIMYAKILRTQISFYHGIDRIIVLQPPQWLQQRQTFACVIGIST